MTNTTKSKILSLSESYSRIAESTLKHNSLQQGYSSLLWGGKYLIDNVLINFVRDSDGGIVIEVEEISTDKDLETIAKDIHQCIQSYKDRSISYKNDNYKPGNILNTYFNKINQHYEKIYCWESLAELFEFLSESIPLQIMSDPEHLWANDLERIQIKIFTDASEILQNHLNTKREAIKESFSPNDLIFKTVLFSAHEIAEQIKAYLTRGNFRDNHIKFLETITQILSDNILDYSYSLDVESKDTHKIRVHNYNTAKKYWFKLSDTGKYFKTERELDVNNEILKWIDNYILTTCPTLVLQKDHQKKHIEEIIKNAQELASLSSERISYMLIVKCKILEVGDSTKRFYPEKNNSKTIIKKLKSAFREFGTVNVKRDKATKIDRDEVVSLNPDRDIHKWIHALFWMNEKFKFETIRRAN